MAGDDVEASSGEESESDVAIDSDESGELPSPSDLDTAFIEQQEQEGQESTSVESVVDDSGISMDTSESEQSLNRSIESLKEAEMKWLAIDERFLSSGLRLLHLLPILAALLIALSRTFRDQSPNWWVNFAKVIPVILGHSVWFSLYSESWFSVAYLIALIVTIRRIRLTMQSVKHESDLQELDGRDFRSVHGHSSLTSRISLVLGQHVLTAFFDSTFCDFHDYVNIPPNFQ